MTTLLRRCRGFAGVGALALFLCACATDQQRTRTEGTVAGVAAGAALGRAITGDDRGTAVGALLGGIVGVFAGHRAAQKKAAYAQREENLRQSAQRATALAESTRTQNDQIEHDIAELDRAVQDLQAAKLGIAAQQQAQSAHRERLAALVASVDQQLQQMNEEVGRQNQLIAETKAIDAKEQRDTAEQEESEGVRLVAAGLRDLEQQTRRLELARLQLQQIDARRAY